MTSKIVQLITFAVLLVCLVENVDGGKVAVPVSPKTKAKAAPHKDKAASNAGSKSPSPSSSPTRKGKKDAHKIKATGAAMSILVHEMDADIKKIQAHFVSNVDKAINAKEESLKDVTFEKFVHEFADKLHALPKGKAHSLEDIKKDLQTERQKFLGFYAQLEIAKLVKHLLLTPAELYAAIPTPKKTKDGKKPKNGVKTAINKLIKAKAFKMIEKGFTDGKEKKAEKKKLINAAINSVKLKDYIAKLDKEYEHKAKGDEHNGLTSSKLTKSASMGSKSFKSGSSSPKGSGSGSINPTLSKSGSMGSKGSKSGTTSPKGSVDLNQKKHAEELKNKLAKLHNGHLNVDTKASDTKSPVVTPKSRSPLGHKGPFGSSHGTSSQGSSSSFGSDFEPRSPPKLHLPESRNSLSQSSRGKSSSGSPEKFIEHPDQVDEDNVDPLSDPMENSETVDKANDETSQFLHKRLPTSVDIDNAETVDREVDDFKPSEIETETDRFSTDLGNRKSSSSKLGGDEEENVHRNMEGLDDDEKVVKRSNSEGSEADRVINGVDNAEEFDEEKTEKRAEKGSSENSAENDMEKAGKVKPKEDDEPSAALKKKSVDLDGDDEDKNDPMA